jgi:HPt (histidine-containing phosphotransfer) domain-containing protein
MNETINLDPAAVERLQRLGGNEFVTKMIDLFGSYATEKLALARKALDAGDFARLADAVHPIKSSAGNVGARRVQELARQIEELGRASKPELLPGLLAELEAAFAAAKSELEQLKQFLGTAPGTPK